MYKTNHNLAKITYIVLLITVIFVAIVKIWVLDKGFNITDEAYAVLGYEPLQERLEVVSVFHRLVHKLLGWLEPSLIAYRASALVLTTFAASFFAVNFYHWFGKTYQSKNQPFSLGFIILLFILGGFVLDYDRHNILNYDVINNALNLTEAGLVLRLITQKDRDQWRSWKFNFGWLTVGFLTSFQFLNKAPSAIAFTLLLAFLILFYRGKMDWQYYLKVTLFFVSGGLLGFVVYFTLFQSFWQYQELLLRQLTLLIGDSSDTSYSIENIYNKENVSSSLNSYQLLFLAIVVYTITFILSRIYFVNHKIKSIKDNSNTKPERKPRTFSKSLLFAGSTISLLLILIQPLYLHLVTKINVTIWYPTIFIFLLVTIAAANIFPAFTNSNYRVIRQTVAVGIFLLLIPFGAAFGTNTSIRALAARNIIPWLALIIILLSLLYHNRKTKNFIYLFIATFILWLGLKITYGQIYHPYRLVSNRLEQTELLQFVQPRAKGLKVDPATAHSVEQLYKIVDQTGFQLGDPIIALHDMPGLVYLLGGTSPGAPWYFSVFPESQVRTCNNLIHSQFDPNRAIFLVNSEISPVVLNCLQDIGIEFPQDYQKIGEVNNPFYFIRPESDPIIQVWVRK